MTIPLSPNNLDDFLRAKGAAPVAGGASPSPNPSPGVAALAPSAPPPPAQPALVEIQQGLQNGNNTLSELNQLVGNIVNLWDKVEGMIERGADRKQAAQGRSPSPSNYDDIVKGRAVIPAPKPGEYGSTSLEETPKLPPSPQGGVNAPAAEQIGESRADIMLEWLVATLKNIEQGEPGHTIKELIESVNGKREALKAQLAPLLK